MGEEPLIVFFHTVLPAASGSSVKFQFFRSVVKGCPLHVDKENTHLKICFRGSEHMYSAKCVGCPRKWISVIPRKSDFSE